MFIKTKTKWYKAFESEEVANQMLKPNQPFYLFLEGKAFCVVRNENGIFAMDDKCPHQGTSLSNGYCLNGNIVCPWHHYHFSVENGRQSGGGGDYVKTHKVVIKNDGIFIGVERISIFGL